MSVHDTKPAEGVRSRAAGQLALYDSVEALQADLDSFSAVYNARWAHHGCRTQGGIPQTFTEHDQGTEAPQAA